MWAHPGKQLLFMGSEIGEEREWGNERPVDWWMLGQWPDHAKLQQLVAELNKLYRSQPALWEQDFNPDGFRWKMPATPTKMCFLSGGRAGPRRTATRMAVPRLISNPRSPGPTSRPATSSPVWPTSRPFRKLVTGLAYRGLAVGSSCSTPTRRSGAGAAWGTWVKSQPRTSVGTGMASSAELVTPTVRRFVARPTPT